MRNRPALYVALILVLCSLSSCRDSHTKDRAPTVSAQTADTAHAAKPVAEDELLKTMPDSKKCWMGLTQKQYLEDFDTLYKELKDNYPFFGVASRKRNVDIKEKYEFYRKRLETCTNDVDFWGIVRGFTNELQYTGHIDAWGYRYASELKRLKAFIKEFPQYAKTVTPYIEKLDNPVSQRNYTAMGNFYKALDRAVQEYNLHAGGSVPGGAGVSGGGEAQADNTGAAGNVTTNIIQNGKIAYVGIEAFDMGSFNKDKKILLPFYEKVQGYENLIIDIVNNTGGGMDYFNQLVVAPLAKKTYRVPAFLLAKGGNNNKYFLKIPEGLKSGTWKPISLLPYLPHMNKEDFTNLDYFMEEAYTVAPSNQKGFSGRIWLLVGKRNYSSAEYAAMFSKQSGFATLVGERTGGDGIGVDPAYIILPNSGLVVQYSPVYGVTSDGRNSEEYGTEPDYYTKEGQTALNACLGLIHEGKVK